MSRADVYAMGRQNWFERGRRGTRGRARARRDVRSKAPSPNSSSSAATPSAALERISAPAIPPSRRGGSSIASCSMRAAAIECDLTVARVAHDRFYLVTGTGFRTHDAAWISDHIRADSTRASIDVTEESATLAVMGPRARTCSSASRATIWQRRLPLRCARAIEIAGPAARWRCASPMSASSAGSCIATPTRRRDLRRPDGRGRDLSARSPAIAPSSRCGWRKAIAPGAPTSRPTTRRSRRAWALRSASREIAIFSAARRSSPPATSR